MIKRNEISIDFLLSLPYAKENINAVLGIASVSSFLNRESILKLYNIVYLIGNEFFNGQQPERVNLSQPINKYRKSMEIVYQNQMVNIQDNRKYAFEIVDTVHKMLLGKCKRRYITKENVIKCRDKYIKETKITPRMLNFPG